MYDTNDTSFFTNESGNMLVDRFNILLKDTDLFDCLVGYFYISGFYKIQKSLESTNKIRILVGMGIDSQTFKLIENTKITHISTAEFKKKIKEDLITEMNRTDPGCCTRPRHAPSQSSSRPRSDTPTLRGSPPSCPAS